MVSWAFANASYAHTYAPNLAPVYAFSLPPLLTYMAATAVSSNITALCLCHSVVCRTRTTTEDTDEIKKGSRARPFTGLVVVFLRTEYSQPALSQTRNRFIQVCMYVCMHVCLHFCVCFMLMCICLRVHRIKRSLGADAHHKQTGLRHLKLDGVLRN